MPTDKIGSGPACDGTKVFIEVTGVQHDTTCHFQFYGAQDAGRKEDIEGQLVSMPLVNTTINSWPWQQNASPVDACLAIAGQQGDILLPLFNDVQPKERVDGEQDYLIHAVVPLTLLPTYNPHLQDNERYAPSRNGYFYVFYNNKAWRELEIHASDSEGVQFLDVDLSAYRAGENEAFSSDQREAVGNPLKDIWLPVKDNNQDTLVHLAYSEVPWSGERLNYFENNVAELHKRAQSLHQLKGMDNPPSHRQKEACVLFASDLPEMRVREPEVEWFVAEPLQFNRDLSGAWLNAQYSDVKKALVDGNEDGDKALGILQYRSAYQYEYNMKQSALQSLIEEDDSTDEDWEASSSIDFLEDAKARQLRTLVLDDPIFDLKHNAFMVLSGVGYMQKVYVDMSQQEYYQTAELVHQMVMTPKFGKQENPLYEYHDDMDTYLGGRFHRTLRTIERQVANRDIKELQDFVNKRLNDERIATVLRDISSLNDMNSAGAYVIAGYGLSVLSIDIDTIDTFAKNDPSYTGNTQQRNKNHQTLTNIFTSNSHPLHNVLFAPEGTVALESSDEYIAPEVLNDGSGFATAQLLAQWSNVDFVLEDERLEVIDVAFLTESNTKSEVDKAKDEFAQTRRAVGVIAGIYSGFFEAVMALKDLESEAKVISFNAAYASVLGLTKITDPKHFGKMLFTSAQGAETKGYVLGVHGQGLSYGLSADDGEYIKNKKRKGLQGTLRDVDGRLVAASNKKSFSNADKAYLGERAPLKVVVLPEDSAVAQAYNQANTQRALRNMDDTNWNSSNLYEKIRIPYLITAIETANLIVTLFSTDTEKNGRLYTGFSVGGAAVDLGIAIAHASKLQSQNASALARVSDKVVKEFSKGTVKTFTFESGARLVPRLSMLGAVSVGAGVLTACLAFWDACRLLSENDTDASMAMFMVSAGTMTTTIATGLFTTSAPILFGMGPIAWLGIGIAVIGAALYFYFLDTPIEKWLKNGPFAEDPAEKYAHLQDNKVAFERFINCLFSVEMKAYKYGTQTGGLPDAFDEKMQAAGVTHAIQVNSNLAALLNQDNVSIDFYARPAIQEKEETRSARTGIFHDYKIRSAGSRLLPIIYQNESVGSNTYFVKYDTSLPAPHTEKPWWQSKFYFYTYATAFIVRARLRIGDSIFPGLPLDEADNPSILPSDSPSFSEDEKFWVSQELVLSTVQQQ